MYKGGCYCGAVKFEISSAISNIVFCHCSECRKLQGSAFASNGVVDAKNFHIISGKDELTAHQLTTTQTRFFCKHCGSPIKSENTTVPEKVRVRLGTIDSDIEEKLQAHIFVSSKANWDVICDSVSQYEEYEPTRS